MKLNCKLSASSIAFALACLGAQAQADVVVFQQHNFIDAYDIYRYQSESSDSLTSWNGTVSLSDSHFHADTSLSSSIAANSVSIDSTTVARGSSGYQNMLTSYARATTQLQFTVSATRTYNLTETTSNNGASIQLLRDGVIVLSGKFKGAFLFEVGHTYEIDGQALASAFKGYVGAASYGFSMQ